MDDRLYLYGKKERKEERKFNINFKFSGKSKGGLLFLQQHMYKVLYIYIYIYIYIYNFNLCVLLYIILYIIISTCYQSTQYSLPEETIAAIMILYRNTKVKVRSPNGDTEYFNIVAGVLQGDTLAPYLFIICLDYVLRTSIDNIMENGFMLTKKRSRRYPAKTITNTDYADDIALLANTPN